MFFFLCSQYITFMCSIQKCIESVEFAANTFINMFAKRILNQARIQLIFN